VGLEGEAFEQAMEAVANLKGVRLRMADIAAAVLYLASDDARYISGHNLLLDGVPLNLGSFHDKSVCRDAHPPAAKQRLNFSLTCCNLCACIRVVL